MLRAAKGKPAAQFVAGEPPDWALVRQRAESLLDSSRDLRLAAYWTRAAVNLDGFSGLLPGLALPPRSRPSEPGAAHRVFQVPACSTVPPVSPAGVAFPGGRVLAGLQAQSGG